MERETGSYESPAEGSDARFQRIWSHREQLLKVARRRSICLEDAEDAVHEAMVRAWERPDLDENRVGAWLTTVTMRLCVDRRRQMSRETDAQGVSPAASSQYSLEEAVCDRLEADWLAQRSSELPPRQAHALWLKSANLDVAQVAEEMGLSYRTVESLLARGRRTLRRLLTAALAFGAWHWVAGRARTAGGVVATGVASTATTLAVLGLLPPGGAARDDVPRATATRPAAPATQHPDGREGPAVAAQPGGAGRSGAAGAGQVRQGTELPVVGVFSVPGPVSVGVLRADTHPGALMRDVRDIRPDVPDVPDLPDIPVQQGESSVPSADSGTDAPAPSAPGPRVPTADVEKPAAPRTPSARTPLEPSAPSAPRLESATDGLP